MKMKTHYKTHYDVLGVSRKASNETIKSAFRKAVKMCHPDLNAGDPTAGPQLRQVLAAYEMLKRPERRAIYDRYLRYRRRASIQRFAITALAGLMSGSIMFTLAVWRPTMQVASAPPPTPHVMTAEVGQPAVQNVVVAYNNRPDVDGVRKSDRAAAAPDRRLPDDGPPYVQQSAHSLNPTDNQSEPQALSQVWAQALASDDALEVEAFAAGHPEASGSRLARSKLITLIDTAEDVALLRILGLGSGAIAERAQQRLVRLGAPPVVEDDRMLSGDHSSALKARAANFVSAHVAGWSSTNTSNLVSLTNAYAEDVLYYGSRKSRQAVVIEKRLLLEHWPERVYAVRPGSITARCLANVCKVGGMMDWQTRNAARTTLVTGTARFEYEVALSGGVFRILSENSSDVKPHRQAASCPKPGSVTGETSMSAGDLQQLAARCLQIAQNTASAKLKRALLAHAQAWKQRAEEQQRIERRTAERLAREAACDGCAKHPTR